MNKINQYSSGERNRAKDINLKELFLVIKRRLWIIALLTALGTIAGAALSSTPTTPLYQTSSRIIIGADEESRTTLQVIIRDSTILDRVVKELNLNMSAEALAQQISVSSIDSSQVVSITVTNANPELAAQIADTTAEVFKEEVPNIVGKDYIRILSNAKVNKVPINPKSNNKFYIAIIGGLVLGIGAAFLLESLDDKLREEDDIEALLGLPLLGKVSKVNNRNVKKKTNKLRLELEAGGETIGHK